LVLSTLHTKDAISTADPPLDMGAPNYMVATSVHAVLAQRLVRLVCVSCAEPHQPTEAEAELGRGCNMDAENWKRRTLSHGRGCSNCNGTGFQGGSVYTNSSKCMWTWLRAANRNDANLFTEIAKSRWRAELGRNAFRLAAEGRTTLAEAIRVASAQED